MWTKCLKPYGLTGLQWVSLIINQARYEAEGFLGNQDLQGLKEDTSGMRVHVEAWVLDYHENAC